MRVFKNSWFRKFATKERISDGALCDAVSRAETGLIDADLGGGLFKQRVPRPGAGRSGGYRTILICRSGVRAVFVFGFAKSDRAKPDRPRRGGLQGGGQAAAFVQRGPARRRGRDRSDDGGEVR